MAKLDSNNKELNSIPINEIKSLYLTRSRELHLDQTKRTWNNFLWKFKQCTKKKRFIITDYGFKGASSCIIARTLSFNQHFFILDISKNIIGDSGAQALADMIKTNTTLVSIILQNNNISSRGSGMLFEALQFNYTITHFDISSPDGLHRNRLQGIGTDQMKKTLKKNDQLSVLNLSCTSMLQEGIEDLAEGMRRNYELYSLNVSSNNLSNICGEILFQGLHSPCKIKWLDVSHNKIGDSSMSYLGGLLDINCGRARLEKINISYCHISSIGIEQFLRFAEKNRYLQILQMNGNSFHQRNIICIKSFLINNTSVWQLEMNNCFIQPEIGEFIGDGLMKSKVLEQLNLGNNSFGNQGLIGIGQGLKKNRSLKVIDLRNNKFDDEGGIEFFKFIIDNTSLIQIDLSQNMLTDVCTIIITEFLKNKYKVVQLSLDKNPIDYDMFQNVEKMVKKNQEIKRERAKPVLLKELGQLKSFTLPFHIKNVDGHLEESNQQLQKARDSLESVKSQLQQLKDDNYRQNVEMNTEYEDLLQLSKKLDLEVVSTEQIQKSYLKKLDKDEESIRNEIKEINEQIKKYGEKTKDISERKERLEIIFKSKIKGLIQTLRNLQKSCKEQNTVYSEISRSVLMSKQSIDRLESQYSDVSSPKKLRTKSLQLGDNKSNDQ